MRCQVIKKYKQMVTNAKCQSEEDTMIKIILPFFEILGWNRLSEDMVFEYPIPDKKRGCTDHVDIALVAHKNGKPDILVEVKSKVPESLSRGTQLSRYLKNKKIKWGIFTNGKELKLITNKGRKSSGPNIVLHFKDLDDFVTYKNALTLFSKGSLIKNKLKSFFEYYHKEYWKKYYGEYKKDYPKNERYKIALRYAEEKTRVL